MLWYEPLKVIYPLNAIIPLECFDIVGKMNVDTDNNS